MLILNLALTLISIFLVVFIILYSVIAVHLVNYIWHKKELIRIKKKYYGGNKNE